MQHSMWKQLRTIKPEVLREAKSSPKQSPKARHATQIIYEDSVNYK